MSLFPDPPDFDGDTFDPNEDADRLATQLRKVYAAMRSGGWWRLAELAREVNGSEAGVSARIRDLRKARHGGFNIERRRVPGGNGLHEYRMVVADAVKH